MGIDDDFATDERANLNKIAHLEKIREEIELFNLENEEISLSQEQDNTEEKQPSICSNLLYPPGIVFFNGKFGCIFTLETLEPPPFLCCNIDDIREFLMSLVKQKLLKLCKNPDDKTVMLKYLFRLNFCVDDWYLLNKIKTSIFWLTDSISRSFLSLFINGFINDLPNLGAREDQLLELKIMLKRPSFSDNSTDHGALDLHKVFRHILEIFAHLLKIESVISQSSHFSSDDQLRRLVTTLIIAAQDPLFINSIMSSEFSLCIEMAFNLFSREGEEFQTTVYHFVDIIGLYWDNSFTMFGSFPHQTATYICSELLPATRLRQSLAYNSLMCCLDLEDTDIYFDVTVSTLVKFFDKYIEKIQEMDSFRLCSFFILLDCCIQSPITSKTEKENLDLLKEQIQRISNTKNTTKGKDPCDLRLIMLAKGIIQQWDSLLANKKPELKQMGIRSFMGINYDCSFEEDNT